MASNLLSVPCEKIYRETDERRRRMQKIGRRGGGEVASHHAYIPYRKKQKTYELKRTQKKGEERQVEIIERRREETRYERAQLQHADGP
jgi:hypothetical protein